MVFKRQGAIGALLDVYEQSIIDLQILLGGISDKLLIKIIDKESADENCRSIQAILSHVVYAANGYATSIKNIKLAHAVQRPDKTIHDNVKGYMSDLTNSIKYTESILIKFNDVELEEKNEQLKIEMGWGQRYDIEQLMEHAIVHILRHTRQIQKIVLHA